MRKAAHLAEYAVFAALLCASSQEEVTPGESIPTGSGPRPRSNDHKGQWRNEAAAAPNPWRPRRVLGCFLVAVVFSLTDEYHQSFVPGRHASFADCGIDSIGAALGILAYSVNHLRLRTLGPRVTDILPELAPATTGPDDFGQDGDATIPSGGLCATGILPVSTHGQDGHATTPSGGQRLPRQIDRIDPIPSPDEP